MKIFHYWNIIYFSLVLSLKEVLTKERLSMSCPNGVCYRNEDEGPCELKDDERRLFRWDPVKKGHIRELELEPGKKYKLITLASKPPIFEIPDFLSDKECEQVIRIAEKVGLHGSYMHSDSHLEERQEFIRGHAKGAAGSFYSWDKDFDNIVSKDEILHFARRYKFLYLENEEVETMIGKLKLKEFDDDKVTMEEFETLPTAAMDEYMNDLKAKDPKHRERHSSQSWLHQGKEAENILRILRKRVQRLTKLSDKTISGSEPMQVVKYDKYGHYNAHYDGQSTNKFSHLDCCHMNVSKVPNCRLCRFVTVLYYLNDVEEGGETAFPVADNVTFSEEAYISTMTDDKFNLMQFCQDANLVVAPKKGQAIMWYNHFVDENTGWLGERDDYTLHGGCGITKGVKWIANNWITAPDVRQLHLRSSFLVDAEN